MNEIFGFQILRKNYFEITVCQYPRKYFNFQSGVTKKVHSGAKNFFACGKARSE